MEDFKGKKVTIMSCSDCNTRCKHCYVSYKGNISGSALLDICNKLKSKYELNINGTEVLMHRDYFDVYNLIGQKRLLSNGIIINKDNAIINLIKNSTIEMVAMSYHFVIHDGISSVSQKLLTDNIAKLNKNGIKSELMCTITTDNYDKVLDICKRVIELGVKKIRFINYMKTGNALNMDDNNILTDDQKNTFFEQLNIARGKYNKEELLIKRCGSFGKDNNHSCNFKCSAGVDEVVIAPDLNVYPCIFMVKPEFKIGEYRDGKVTLLNKLINNHDRCLASDYYNKNMELEIR